MLSCFYHRFGPYIQHKTLCVALPQGVDARSITAHEALTLMEAKVAARIKRGREPYPLVGREQAHVGT